MHSKSDNTGKYVSSRMREWSNSSCTFAGTQPLALAMDDITSFSVASDSTYAHQTPQSMMQTPTRQMRSPYLSGSPVNSPVKVLQGVLPYSPITASSERSSAPVGSGSDEPRPTKLYEEDAGLKVSKGEFICKIAPTLLPFLCYFERWSRVVPGPDFDSVKCASADVGHSTETGLAPSDQAASVTLSDIQRLTQAFASSAVGSAAKRRQYSSPSMLRESAGLDSSISSKRLPEASAAGPAHFERRNEAVSTSDDGVEDDVLSSAEQKTAGERHDVVQTDSKDGMSIGTSIHHLDAVKRLNAMLSQLDVKDRDALKLRASQL